MSLSVTQNNLAQESLLLKGSKEWKQVPEIVRLTLKAVKDVLKSQGKALKDMERHLS